MQPASRLLKMCGDTAIVSHANTLSGLQRWLESQLPDPMQEQCQVVNFRDDTLILAASSPVWATRLRYLLPQLNALISQKTSGKLLKIKIKVRPSSELPGIASRPEATISAATGQLLDQMATAIDHPGLSAALTRIAAHSRKI